VCTCRFAEFMVMISFIVLALTWLTKKPGFFTGWIELMPIHQPSVVITAHFVFGSRPSDHYFRSVCLSVCLFVCLFVQSFSQPFSIRFGSN